MNPLLTQDMRNTTTMIIMEIIRRKIHHDLNTGQREETYKFNDTDYKEAVNLVPSSDYKQNIECSLKQTVNDTLITRITLNGVLNRVMKEYIDGKKEN